MEVDPPRPNLPVSIAVRRVGRYRRNTGEERAYSGTSGPGTVTNTYAVHEHAQRKRRGQSD